MNLAFYRFKDLELLEQAFFGVSNMDTFGSNISLIKLLSLIVNYAKSRIYIISGYETKVGCS